MTDSELLRVGLTEPLRLGFADVYCRDGHGLVLEERRSGVLMADLNDPERFRTLMRKKHLNRYPVFMTTRESLARVLTERYDRTLEVICRQAVYTRAEPPASVLPEGTEIRLLGPEHADTVCANYHMMESSYIRELLADGQLWGLFEGPALAGFIGIHKEGGMGLLEVLPAFRRRGYALALESFLIRRHLEQKLLPFCQVLRDNEPSLALQRKLGLELSEGFLYWLA